MTPLAEALKKKFASPQEAIAALGLDSALLDDERTEGLAMDTVQLGRKAARAKNVVMAVLRPRLAQDARIDLNPIFADVSDREFKAKLPVITKAIKMTVRGKLAQDQGIEDLEDLLAAVQAEKGEGGPPADNGEQALGPSSGLPMGGEREEEPTENKIVDYLKDKVTPEHLATVADMLRAGDRRVDDRRYEDDERKEEEDRRLEADRRAEDAQRRLGRDESEEEREEREEKESAQDARKRLGRDESEEECRDRRARLSRARDVHRAYDRWRASEDARRHRAEDRRHRGEDRRLEEDRQREEEEDRRLEEDWRKAAEDLRKARAADRGHNKDRREEEEDRRPRRAADRHRAAADQPPGFKGMPEPGKGPPAMDEAAVKATVAKAIAERDNEHRLAMEAREFVRPIVGSLPLALDSAEEIYRAACRARSIPIQGVHPSAYRALLDMHRQTSSAGPQHYAIAQDAAAARGFDQRFPEVGRVVVQG